MTAELAMSESILAAADHAGRAIPPLWPLASSVAVNPFLGQTSEPLATVAARLRRVAGCAVTLPRAHYAAQIAAGEVTDADLAAALADAGHPLSLATLKEAARVAAPPPGALPTVADLAAAASGTDWPGLIAERCGHFAASYFDQGQALWPLATERGVYAAWRAVATHDLTPEIAGLYGFAATVAELPDTAEAAIARAVATLGVPEAALPTYFHALLTTLGGWAQVARYRLWQAELGGGDDAHLTGLLAVRLVWEEALWRRFGGAIGDGWRAALAGHARRVEPDADDRIDAVLQGATEHAYRRRLLPLLGGKAVPAARPALQAAFCIDVRSEVLRRALEGVDPGIATLGFAGFFGLGVGHRRSASDTLEARLPVLLTPGVGSTASAPGDDTARIKARGKRAWGRFKLAAISSFAFVEAAGPLYVGKLVGDALALRKPAAGEPAPRFDPPLDDATRATIAETVLRAMSLTDGFARLVIVAGHGASATNNPHLSALHCGACGGYPGDVNARLLAGLLNDPAVRTALAARGIVIPRDTWVAGALHDTTQDVVTVFADDVPASHAADVAQARRWFAAAGAVTRRERAARLPGRGVARRASDWAEVRPEWGLAGCAAFVAAPRARTAGRDLQGRVFLHDYDWRRDEGFGVLTLILTAPVVVASWISLQYYGSAVAPATFGGGNKLLHNVSGGIGVVEGNGGLLRAGLPSQSVDDGEALVHTPLRLTVVVEAPCDAIGDILGRHDGVRALFDNEWLDLIAMDEDGRPAARYRPGLRWEAVSPPAPPASARAT